MLLAFRALAQCLITFACMSAFALQIKAPDIAPNGDVIPVEIQLDQPLTAGGRIELSVNGRPTVQLRVVAGSVSSFSTRVKGYRSNTNTISAATIVGGSQTESGARDISTTVPASPGSLGSSVTSPGPIRVRTSAGKVLVIVSSANSLEGSLILKGAGFHVVVIGSHGLSKDPFFSVSGSVSGDVTASLEGHGGNMQASSTPPQATGAHGENAFVPAVPSVAQGPYGGRAGAVAGGSGDTPPIAGRQEATSDPSRRETGGTVPVRAQPSVGDAAAQAQFESVCAAEIKRFKAAYPGVSRAEWVNSAWKQRFSEFWEPQAFFQLMRTETYSKKLADLALKACGSAVWLHQDSNGVGSGAKSWDRWRKANADLLEKQGTASRSNGMSMRQDVASGISPKSATSSAAITKGRWPAGVEPGNLYILTHGRRNESAFYQTVLVSARSQSEAISLLQEAVDYDNQSNKGFTALTGYRREIIGEPKECTGPNWGATVTFGPNNKSLVSVSVCGASTPREAIEEVAKECARKYGQPCHLNTSRDGNGLSVAIGHSGASPWGGIKSGTHKGFGGPHIGGWPDASLAALGASTRQFSGANLYISEPNEAISQFGKGCGAKRNGRDTHSCWITSRNLECVWTVEGDPRDRMSNQQKCVDTKLTADGYIP